MFLTLEYRLYITPTISNFRKKIVKLKKKAMCAKDPKHIYSHQQYQFYYLKEKPFTHGCRKTYLRI